MALLQNQRILFQLPLRFRGGAGISMLASESDGASLRNIFAGGVDPTSAVPNGASPGFGIILAQKGGGMSCYTGMSGSASLSSSMALGLAALATLVGQSNLAATGGLIAALIATLVGSSTFSSDVLAALNGAATLAGSGNVTAAISAIGYAASICVGTSTVTLTPYATGTMTATISALSGSITPDSVAAAVWNNVNIEGTYTGAEILRLLAAVAAGKTTIVSNVATFRDVNDTKDRVVATMTGSQRTTVTKVVT